MADGSRGPHGHLPEGPTAKLLSEVVIRFLCTLLLEMTSAGWQLGGTWASHPSPLAVWLPPPLPLKELFINHRDLPSGNKEAASPAAYMSGSHKHSVNSVRAGIWEPAEPHSTNAT